MRTQPSSLFSYPLKSSQFSGLPEEIDSLLDIDYYNIKKAAIVFRALNHALRQQVIKTIHENKRITVTELYVKLRLEQSVASQHLAILRKAGIVSTQRYQKFIYYSINYSRIQEINRYSKNLGGYEGSK
jgi:DNA-binding transcriptional ArsR family regulator